jgi:hypothetical protein
MRRQIGWLQGLLAPSVTALLLLAGAPAIGQSVSFSPAALSFSPAGPYSVPRDAAVGSQVASAVAGAGARGVNCALIETAR